METDRAAIGRLQTELMQLRIEMSETTLAIQNRVTALEALHGHDKPHVSPHEDGSYTVEEYDTPAHLVNRTDWGAWIDLMYIAEYCEFKLRIENGLWFMSISELKGEKYLSHAWSGYDNPVTMLRLARQEVRKTRGK